MKQECSSHLGFVCRCFYCIPNSHTEWQTRLELPKPAPCSCGALLNVACSNRSQFIGVHLDQVYDCLSAHDFLRFLIFSGHKRHVANEILFSFMLLDKTRGLSSQLAMSIKKHWHEVLALASSVSHTAYLIITVIEMPMAALYSIH